MKVEEEYENVLMNIEMNLVMAYEDPEMTDAQVQNVVNGLIRTYKAEQKKRSAPKLKLPLLAEGTFERMHSYCDLMIERDSDEESGKVKVQKMLGETVSLDVMIACLKRIEKSIKLWNKEGGRRGYYSYVSQFLPLRVQSIYQ